ncbi:MAG: protein mraZ [Bacteroidales bacterium]|jgi:MraZ protein|nr:protein mraZ [Bacteroidales bacterium]
MTTFIGDYNCKIDAKGRITFPSTLKKQMGAVLQDKFVVKKDIFEKCLVLFPLDEWDRQNKIIRNKLNPYNQEHNKFLRNFYRGSAEVILDGNNRLLLPKRLLNLVEIKKDVVLAGQNGKIEIWSNELYESFEEESQDFAALAEKIMGGDINRENFE